MRKRKNQSQQSQQDDECDEANNQEHKLQIRKPKIERIDNFKNLKKIVINVSMTQYPVVIEVAQSLGWKVQTSNDAGDWDVFWTDFSVDPDILIKMYLFQKINYFPGIFTIARKNLLGHNLRNMGNLFPNQYNFFPMTWMLPQQYSQFRQYYQNKLKGKVRTYIVKPEAQCQGRGIFLTRKIQDMETGKHYVVQRYMTKPYLLQGLKFDMRIYVLMCGTDPLKLYLYNQGLARLATQYYQQPSTSNLQNLCMHLTNYAINKQNPKFIFNKSVHNMGVGHKRALSCVMKQLQKRGLDVKILKQKIKDVIIKTIISGLPLIAHQYKFSQPEDYSGNMCFHILGMDIMLNNKGDPFVIEVNHTPSFSTDTPLDHKIKFELIRDTLVLMNINVKKKTQLYNKCRLYNTQRLLTGKRHIYEGEDRQTKINQAQQQREKYESKNLGGFQKIYPLEDKEKNKKYEQMIGASMRAYLQQNHAIKARYQQGQLNKLIRSELKTMKTRSKKIQFLPQTNTQALKQRQMIKLINQKNQDSVPFSPASQQLSQNLSFSNPGVTYIRQDSIHQLQSLKQIGLQNRSMKHRTIEKINSIRNTKNKDAIVNYSNTDKKIKSQSNAEESSHLLGKSNIRAIHRRENPSIDFGEVTKKKQIKKNINDKHQYQLLNSDAQIIKKQVQRILNNRALGKSEQKVQKLQERVQKQLKKNYNKKLSYNGGYVMPKIYCLNIGSKEKDKQKEKQFLNLITIGQKIQKDNSTQNS